MKEMTSACKDGWSTLPGGGAARRRWAEHTFLALARIAGLVGDAVCVLGVLFTAFTWSHQSDGPVLPAVMAWLYAGLGVTIFIGAFAYNGMYGRELLLDRRK